jgi:hypothetical protein
MADLLDNNRGPRPVKIGETNPDRFEWLTEQITKKLQDDEEKKSDLYEEMGVLSDVR